MNLSDFELDVMNVVWQQGECTAPDVHLAIKSNKNVSYSTVKTIIDRLEKKGAIARTGSEGGKIYFQAAVTPEVVQSSMVSRMLRHVFAGQRRPLFSHLLSDGELSAQDLDYLEALLKEKKKEAKP